MLRLCSSSLKITRRYEAVRILNQYPTLLAAKAQIDASTEPVAPHQLIVTYFAFGNDEPGFDSLDLWVTSFVCS